MAVTVCRFAANRPFAVLAVVVAATAAVFIAGGRRPEAERGPPDLRAADTAATDDVDGAPIDSEGAHGRPERNAAWNPNQSVQLEEISHRVVPPETGPTFTAADYARHMKKLKGQLPKDGFTVVIQPPFVVIGDESPATVRARANKTVKWAVDKLKDAFFKKDPENIINIWLFKDKRSYEEHCRSIFGRTPTTPYGFFLHSENALVMNIATGGGTLVHEIVHPFVASDFPECPAWLNEGLGSLYEQSAERDGKIVGLTNWRLVGGWPPNTDGGLQRAIREKRVPSLHALCSTTDAEFYRDDTGTNYAHARYLCYYLQEHGVLREFYRTFRSNHQRDPTGYNSLKAVLGRPDMKQFRAEWEDYILKLTFP
jgi:hypothetical protein